MRPRSPRVTAWRGGTTGQPITCLDRVPFTYKYIFRRQLDCAERVRQGVNCRDCVSLGVLSASEVEIAFASMLCHGQFPLLA